MERIILASASPRRRELLLQGGIEFDIETADIDENIGNTDPKELVVRLSYLKALEIAKKHPGIEVLGADTVVALDGKILGKPEDEEDAYKMLKMLSGKVHQVYTGVSIVKIVTDEKGESEIQKNSFYECTDVEMYDNDDEMIRRYIATKEPMDKAGSYGIQGRGAILVKRINGDYNNVVGLPLARVVRALK